MRGLKDWGPLTQLAVFGVLMIGFEWWALEIGTIVAGKTCAWFTESMITRLTWVMILYSNMSMCSEVKNIQHQQL